MQLDLYHNISSYDLFGEHFLEFSFKNKLV
jgi:hypothetical protein